MSSKKLPILPSHAGKWLRYVVAFSVTLGVGLAPLLGRVRVPGFTPIIELFPVNVQTAAVPFAAFLMAIPAVLVQYFAGERVRFFRPRVVLALSAVLFALVLSLFSLYDDYVIQVQPNGGADTLSYIVGSRMDPNCVCAKKHLPIRQCIGPQISADPLEIDSCYDEAELRARKKYLSLTWILLTATFGILIGLLVLKESTVAGAKSSKKKQKKR